MKSTIKLMLTIVTILAMASCTTFPQTHGPDDWFQPQSDTVGLSIESLSECGPAVARNFVHWQTGRNLPRPHFRNKYKSPKWWTMRHIQNAVRSEGGQLDLIKFNKYDMPRIPNGSKAIFHVYNTHFVTVAEFLPDGMVVWDTNSGIKKTTRNAFFRLVSYNYYLIGRKY